MKYWDVLKFWAATRWQAGFSLQGKFTYLLMCATISAVERAEGRQLTLLEAGECAGQFAKWALANDEPVLDTPLRCIYKWVTLEPRPWLQASKLG